MSYIFIPLFVLLISVLGAWGYAEYHIAKYSIYYAQHLPHGEDTDPVMAMVVDYLWSIERPELEGYRYDDDGDNLIGLDNKYITKYDEKYDFVRHTFDNDSDRFEHYYFSNSGKFLYYTPDRDKTKFKEIVYENQSKISIKKLLAPIIDSQPTPGINLQWYFNWKYQKRFE